MADPLFGELFEGETYVKRFFPGMALLPPGKVICNIKR